MQPTITKKQLIPLILIIGLAIVLFLTLKLAGTRQELRKKAGSSSVELKLFPVTDTLQVGTTKSFDLIATFASPQTGEKLDYLLTEVSFDKNYLEIPNDKLVQVAFTTNPINFTRVFKVDSPQEANTTGKVVIELGTATKGGGPSTSTPITVARIFFKGKANTPSQQSLTVGNSSLIVNSQSAVIPVSAVNASYTVGGAAAGTPTPTVTQGPSPTPGGAITPPPGPGGFVQIFFKAKLANTQNNPEMNMKLRVKDELAFVDNPAGGAAGTCNSPASGEKDFDISVKATDGVYVPATSDGWVSLDGITPGRYYTLILKAPKTRGEKVAEHVILSGGQLQTQQFDWTNKPLDPGDLPNPDDGGKQDCTVNSVDLSLITDRIGATDEEALKAADVNYDGVVNGNDVSKVVNTLSTKPDDDL